MPGTGPVYQPTTVSYETRPGLLAQTAATVRSRSPLRWLRRPVPQALLLCCALAAIGAGLALCVNGVADYEDTAAERRQLVAEAAEAAVAASDQSSTTTPASSAEDADETAAAKAAKAAADATTAADRESQVDCALVVCGVLLLAVGFVLAGLYVKVADWRRSYVCPCGLSKKHAGLARQMQQQSDSLANANAANAALAGGLGASGGGGGSGGVGGQMMAMNPSTDPLVSHTQYAPVSELPARPEDEECRTLMLAGDANKECLSSAEESDRMLDADPRIVLRPLGHVEEA